jgi:hypothetical protein
MALSGGRNSARARIAAVSVELLFGRRGRRSFLRPGNVSFVFNGDTVMPLFLRFSAIEPATHQHKQRTKVHVSDHAVILDCSKRHLILVDLMTSSAERNDPSL